MASPCSNCVFKGTRYCGIICGKWWLVAFLLFFAVSSWAACRSGETSYYPINNKQVCSSSECSVGQCPSTYSYAGYIWSNPVSHEFCSYGGFTWDCSGHEYWSYTLECRYTFVCNTQAEADSVYCELNPNDENCQVYVDTTYKCVNGSLESNTYGERPIARVYRCIGDTCGLRSELNGTCQDWGYCPEGETVCDISPDSTGRRPCTRAGGPTTSGTRCYYQCPDGSSMACKPTGTEYVAGTIYVGTCPDRPPESCYPSSSSTAPGSSGSSPGTSEPGPSSSDSAPPPDTITDGTQIDYTRILQAIHDTLHRANKQREVLESWDLDFMPSFKGSLENIESYTLNTWQKDNDINSQLSTLHERPFTLTDDIKDDLDSAHSLLDDINQFLRNDTLRTYNTDTSYNPLLRDIRDRLDSTGSPDSVYGLLKPYFSDSGQWDSPITKFLNTIADNFGRDSSEKSFCSRYYACVRERGFSCRDEFPNWTDCLDGGTPIDGIANIELGILETLWDAIFGDDSTPVPPNPDASDTVDVLPPGFSSASLELQAANDSLGRFDVRSVVDSMRAMLDSARRMNQDTTKIQPDSLWLDSSQAAQYVDHLLLPSGTGTDCFVCRADLGTFNGLSDTTLKVYIDFSDFGGFNWCEIIRAVVKIATLVTCISLTLGSWAAAFGYNPKNDA